MGFPMNAQQLIALLKEHLGSELEIERRTGIGQSSINRWAHGAGITDRSWNKLLLVAMSIPEIAARVQSAPVSPSTSFSPSVVPGNQLVGDRSFPIYAAAMGGDGHHIVTFEAIDYVRRPSILEHVSDGYGLYIVGDSMSPAYEAGDLALVNPRLPPAREKDVVLYHVPPQGGEAEAIIKRLVRFNDIEWGLKQYNPLMEFQESRADWTVCHRIAGKYLPR